MTPKRRPGDPQNRSKIDKKLSQWPPERHLDPQMSPGGYIGVKIRLKRCFFYQTYRNNSSSWDADSLEKYNGDSDCSLQRVCPPSC